MLQSSVIQLEPTGNRESKMNGVQLPAWILAGFTQCKTMYQRFETSVVDLSNSSFQLSRLDRSLM